MLTPARRRLRLVVLLLVAAVTAAAAGALAAEREGEPLARPPAGAAPAAPPVRVPDVPRQRVLPPIAAPSGPEFALPAGAAFAVRLRGGGPRGGALVDLDSGRVLWARGWRTPRLLASVTKVMTALVAVEALRPDERVRVSRRAAKVRGSRAGLVAGARPTADALLHGLMLPSGNDAAIALAEGVAGSEAAFVRRMNARARAWGLRCTRYTTASGLGRGGYGGPGSVSCPADLAELARRALAAPRLARIVRRRTARVDGGRGPLRLATTNPLLRAGVPGVLGLKTGWTPRAGRCLVAVVERGGRRYAAILLDDPDPGTTARRLLAAAERA